MVDEKIKIRTIKNNNGRYIKMNQNKKMPCPRCSTILRKAIMAKIKHPSGAILDVCSRCGGMWLDKGEVRLLYDYSNKKARSQRKKVGS